MTRSDLVGHLHDRQWQRQVGDERTQAIERDHLRAEERRASAPDEFDTGKTESCLSVVPKNEFFDCRSPDTTGAGD